MLLYVLSIFALIYSVSSKISCYDCSLVPEQYNYIITADNIPAAFQNCQVNAEHTRCSIKLRWYLNADETRINMASDDTDLLSTEHTLQADIAMSDIGVTQSIQHSLYYFCSTDRCNDANQLKRLLESFTISNKFTDLDDLLTPTLPFNGTYCLLEANYTNKDCPSPTGIDPYTCKQCVTTFAAAPTISHICASCFTDDIHDESISREVLFNMTDRRSIDRWTIHCRSEDCNGLSTGQRINEKSVITFDFEKFFNTNASHQIMSTSSVNFALIIMTFFIKIFY